VTDKEPNKLYFGSVSKVSFGAVRRNIESKQRFCSCVLVVLTVLALGFACLEQQLLWDNEHKPNDGCDNLKCLVSLLSICTAAVVIRRQELVLKEQKHCGLVTEDTSLWSSHLTRSLLCEVIFNLLCSPPYFQHELAYYLGSSSDDLQLYGYYSIDALATIVVAMRFYHGLPLLLGILQDQAPNETSVSLGTLFSVKTILKTNPVCFLATVSVLLCALFAYACWIFERGYCAPWKPQYHDLEIESRCSGGGLEHGSMSNQNMGDAYWAMLNTMTTLGNPVAPLTVMSRVVTAGALMAGMSVFVLMVHAATCLMALTPFEKRTFENNRKLAHRRTSYKKAAILIEASWLRYAAVRNDCNKDQSSAHFSLAFHRFRTHQMSGGRTVRMPTEQDMMAQTLAMIMDTRVQELKEHMEARQTAAMDEMRESIAELTRAVLQQPQRPSQPQDKELVGQQGAAGSVESIPGASPETVAAAVLVAPEPLDAIALALAGAHDKGTAKRPGQSVMMSPLAGMQNVTKEEKELARKMLHSDSDDDNSEDEEEEEESVDIKKKKQTGPSFKRIVVEIYEKHNPEKLDSVDSLMKKYVGNENLLIQKLAAKYKCKLPATDGIEAAAGHWMA
jgi:hypothetical protein